MKKIRAAIILCLFGAPLWAQPIPRFRLQEQRADGFFQKGLLFYHSYRYAAAREFFYKALNVHPYFHLARRYLGDSYYYAGDWAAALEHWEFLSATSQNTYPLVHQRSQLLRFRLGHTRQPEKYVFLRQYHPKVWPGYSFRRPADIGLDHNGELYLASFGSANVLRFSATGDALDEVSGPFYDSLKAPLGISIGPEGRIYVCDYEEDRVRVFSSEGRAELSFGTSGTGSGQFHGPSGIIVHDGFIYVSDAGNRRIQKFDRQGQFLLELGRNLGEEPPLHPAGLTVDENEILYVADRDGARILRFDLDGNFLDDLSSEFIKRPRGLHFYKGKLIIADEEKGIVFYYTRERRWSPLNDLRDPQDRLLTIVRPFAARMDPTGALYVADYGGDRLLLLVPLGMRVSNLNCKIQRIDTNAFPQIAVFISAHNRLGYPLLGLTHRSFLLSENDHPIEGIKTDNMIPYNRRAGIAIVKENSLFYAQNYERYLSPSLEQTLGSLRIADMVYLVEAGQDARLVYEGLERRRILRLLAKGSQSGEPNLGKGLYEGLSHLVKRIGPRSVVLLVSGKHYANAFSQYSLDRLTQYAVSHTIPIHVLSYEGERDPQKKQETDQSYRMLAEHTKGRYFRAFDEKALGSLYDLISNNKDSRYILTYNTTLSRKLKGRYAALRLELEYLGTLGLADAGYFIP